MKNFLFYFKKRFVLKNWLSCFFINSVIGRFMKKRFKRDSYFLKYQFTVNYTNGMRLLVRADIWKNLDTILNIFNEYLEDSRLKLNKNDVVLDIGAHIGSFAIPAFFAGAIVYAFEPDPENFRILNNSLKINSISLGNRFFLENVAVFATSGFAKFSLGRSSSNGSLVDVGFFKMDNDARQIICKTITLEDIFQKYFIEKCYLLKMDCEGSEYDIFYSINSKLLRKIEYITMEVHKVRNREPNDLKRYLENQGFDIVYTQLHKNGCYDFCFHNSLY